MSASEEQSEYGPCVSWLLCLNLTQTISNIFLFIFIPKRSWNALLWKTDENRMSLNFKLIIVLLWTE